ncbi:hypothetical protein MMPV_007762 [Pyropia vietnamensis]
MVADGAAAQAAATAAEANRNGVLLQAFPWDPAASGDDTRVSEASEAGLWRHLADGRAAALAAAGFTALWLPPPVKGFQGDRDVGYGVYDLYDLGEFPQCGSVRTKYGTREELLAAIDAAHAAGLRVLADIVLGHRLGADATQRVTATPYTDADRTVQAGRPRKILAHTKFTCPGRGGRYSDFVWNAHSFSSVDVDASCRGGRREVPPRVYLIDGHSFSAGVSTERGNYDHLMGANVDLAKPAVVAELVSWGHWFSATTGVDGYRLDAVKHMDVGFYADAWLPAMRARTVSPARIATAAGPPPVIAAGVAGAAGAVGAVGIAATAGGCLVDTPPPPLFAVAEYWSEDVGILTAYLAATHHSVALFDVPLHARFAAAGRCADTGGGDGDGHHATPPADLTTLLDGTLVAAAPAHAVTFVENHDTVAGAALASPVAEWFKPLAYAVVLLRAAGLPGRGGGVLAVLLRVRRAYAYGPQVDYFGEGGRGGRGSVAAAAVAGVSHGHILASDGDTTAGGDGDGDVDGGGGGGGGNNSSRVPSANNHGARETGDWDTLAADPVHPDAEHCHNACVAASDGNRAAPGGATTPPTTNPDRLPGGRHLIGWTRSGWDGDGPPRGVAVVLSSGAGGAVRMRAPAGSTYRDMTRASTAAAAAADDDKYAIAGVLTVGADGWAAFPVRARSVAVWVADA